MESQILSDGVIYDELKCGRLTGSHIEFVLNGEKAWSIDIVFVIDGMTRLRIAKRNGLELRYNPNVKEFNSKEEVFQWIFDHQKNRRNWSEWQTIQAASELIQKIKDSAKGRMGYGVSVGENARRSRIEIANKTGLSQSMVRDAEFVLRYKDQHQEILSKLENQEISIGQAAQRIKNKSKEAKNILQVPNFFSTDARILSIYIFFKVYYHCGGKLRYKEVAKLWQSWKDVSEDDLSIFSIVKNYERMEIDIKKEAELINQILAS